jgi:hypothetical protein
MLNRGLIFALAALTLVTGIAGAQTFENSSVVGQFQDQIMVTVHSGVKMNTAKAAGDIYVGIQAMDEIADSFQVYGMTQFYAGLTSNFADKSVQEHFDRIWCVQFPEGKDIKQVMAAYEALPQVEKVEMVNICKMFDATLPNDPGLNGNQYYVRNMAIGGADLRCVGAWNETVGDSNVVIAIIDTGMDYTHPDLGGTHADHVNGAVWTNWTEYYGTPGVDDDSNGKIDDFRGWDFVNISPSQGWPEEDVTTADNDPMDWAGHGTNCGGCAAGIGDNGIGIAGVAHGCKIMAVRAGWIPAGEEHGVIGMSFAAASILYATNNGADIINCSWGSDSSLSMAVTAAQNQGVLIVTAAGNADNEVASYLATRTGVLAVAATESNDIKASFSSYGTWVELSAPGQAIYTTGCESGFNQTAYMTVDGTSFSSPIACGAAALLMSAYPAYSTQQIVDLLLDTCDPIDHLNSLTYEGKLGVGRINLQKALGDNIQQYPGEYPTLFDAQNCAQVGDIIAIEGGITLDGPFVIHGDKGLDILGGYDATYTTRDPLGTPVNIQASIVGTGISFSGNIDNETIVDGFLIQGGGGLTFSGIPYSGKYGGGMILNGASPTLRNMVITGNSVGSASQLGGGGGMMLNNSSAILENIEIHGNSGIFGAGLYAYNSDFTMINVDIHDNTLMQDNLSYAPRGGGMHLIDSIVDMTSCTVDGHLGSDMGGGIYLGASSGSPALNMTNCAVTGNNAKTSGGGIYVSSGAVNLNAVEITGNHSRADASFHNGGGFSFINSSVVMDGVNCSDNNAHLGGGGIIDGASSAVIENSIFAGNTAMFYGGALALQNVTSSSLTSNTMVANDGTFSGSGGLYIMGASPALNNNILAFNTGAASQANGIHVVSGTPTFSCNDVFDNAVANYGGTTDPTGTNGNIAADPLFCDIGVGNFGISEDSPCATASCGVIGAAEVGCGVTPAIDDTEILVPLAFKVEQNYPNPFNPSTTISFSLPRAAHTNVAIYDVAGHLVKTLLDEPLAARIHDVVWTGRNDRDQIVATGVYFYLVSSGENRAVGRMALVK